MAQRRRPGRPGISSLPPAPMRFNVARTPGFEGDQAKEDARRARMLRWRARTNAESGEALRDLANRIDPNVNKYPNTPASSRYMRRQRIRVLSAVWRLMYDS